MWVNQYTAGWPEWVIILVAIFGIIFSVMWILLPFAVSSILGKASKQLKVSEEILYELNRHRQYLAIQPVYVFSVFNAICLTRKTLRDFSMTLSMAFVCIVELIPVNLC